MAKKRKTKKTAKKRKTRVKKSKPKKKVKKAKPKKLAAKKMKPKKLIELQEPEESIHRTRIRVIGIGGGGGSIVSEIASKVKKVDFVAANTDLQALKTLAKGVRPFHFGQSLTKGLGCGMDSKLGQKAAKADKDKIAKLFKGIDLCVFVACLGGGTGSGAAPEFAKITRDLGVITFGIFTLPFKFEGGKRVQIARTSLKKITPNLNTISTIPNENIFQIINTKTPLKEAFSAINKRLAENLRGLIEMIYLPGLINIDFADLKTILEGRGRLAYLNSAQAQGPKRAEEAVKEVLKSPLNEYSIHGADKIIFDITASKYLGMKEVELISRTISDFNRRAKIIFGISQQENYKDKIRVTLLAVGCGRETSKKRPSKKPKPKPKLKPKLKPRHKPRRRPKSKPKRKTRRKPRPKPKPLPAEAPAGAKAGKPKPKPTRSSDRVPRRMTGQTPKPKPKRFLRKKSSKSSLKAKKKEKTLKSAALAKSKAVSDKEINSSSASATKSPGSLVEEILKPLIRRNALDVKKEIEKTEKEMLEQEKRWDIPAFLRRRINQ